MVEKLFKIIILLVFRVWQSLKICQNKLNDIKNHEFYNKKLLIRPMDPFDNVLGPDEPDPMTPYSEIVWLKKSY